MHVKMSPVLQIVRGTIQTLETSFPHAITEPGLDLQQPGRSCSVGNAGAGSDTESSTAFHEV